MIRREREKGLDLQLKETRYNCLIPGVTARVAYVIERDNIWFAGLESGQEIDDPYQAAELVVFAICTEEGIDYHNYNYYLIETHRAFNWAKPGEFSVEKLEFEDKESYFVHSRTVTKTIQEHADKIKYLGVQNFGGLSAQLMRMFKPLITS
ncbi:hypothetical protein A2V80_02685 [Candidatus Woesebacteria bacterium RBG_16_39_8b]|uniref:Uncharacterized protein n=1 Tax=Candidatus Woesebacteria bacterium RBG_16_39_8b TaxID=1802482 RepID=A0A1F7X9F5_9BACT|nr:MAG: hypothetical protein A2V80_02685 [Candidatus Woesebacteria bacterium RBG_16_39_8b]